MSSLAIKIQELLARLDQHCGSFPEDLVVEAMARREEVTPRFLEILEDIDRNPEPWLADHRGMLHIYALYFVGDTTSTKILADAHELGYDFEVVAKPTPPEELLARLGNP